MKSPLSFFRAVRRFRMLDQDTYSLSIMGSASQIQGKVPRHRRHEADHIQAGLILPIPIDEIS